MPVTNFCVPNITIMCAKNNTNVLKPKISGGVTDREFLRASRRDDSFIADSVPDRRIH